MSFLVCSETNTETCCYQEDQDKDCVVELVLKLFLVILDLLFLGNVMDFSTLDQVGKGSTVFDMILAVKEISIIPYRLEILFDILGFCGEYTAGVFHKNKWNDNCNRKVNSESSLHWVEWVCKCQVEINAHANTENKEYHLPEIEPVIVR